MQKAGIRSWLIWLIAGIFYLFEFLHRVVINVMVPELSAAFNVSSALLSSLSAAYFFAYAFAQIPVGILIDRYGTRKLLTSACLIITISSAIFAFTHSLTVANYCRLFIGLGSAFAFVGCLKLASTWFPANKFAFVVGLTNFLGVIGAVLGGRPLANAVDAFGWRQIMLGSTILGSIITILLWIVIKDYAKPEKIVRKAIKSKVLANIVTVIKDKQTWLIAIFAGCMVAPIVTYSELWSVTFLNSIYNLPRPQAAYISTLTFVGIGIGGPTIGWLSDYYQQRTAFMGIGMLGALVTISLILFGPKLSLSIVSFLHLIFGFFSSSMLLAFSLNSEETPPKIRATTVAFTNSIIMIAGAALQTISGFLLDKTYNNFNLSFVPLVGCYVLAFYCYTRIIEPPCEFIQEE